MKKFLIFLVAIVVVVCFGLTIFYFVRNDEVINFTTKEIYCNIGDIITKDELGLTIKKGSKKTKFNYNANEEISRIVSFDEEHEYYIVNENEGGDYSIVITTTNKKFPKFEIVLHIGDGLANPYYISGEKDLQNIGTKYDSSRKFTLRNDIRLTENFKTISNFSGTFMGNGHTISNINVETDNSYAGLFGNLNGATITNLNLAEVNIDGNYQYAGALAAKSSGSTISCVAVKGGKITSSAENSIIGGLVGEMVTSNRATSLSVEDVTLTGDYTVGGLIGKLNGCTLQATYAKATIAKKTVEDENSTKLGGLIGEFVVSTSAGSIQQSYADSTSDYAKFGSFIGTLSAVPGFADEKELQYLIGNYSVGAANREIANNTTGMYAKKPNNPSNTSLSDPDTSKYFITNKTTEAELAGVGNFIFYAIKGVTTPWSENAWILRAGYLPTLTMKGFEVPSITAEYLNTDNVDNNIVGNGDTDANRNALTELLSKGTITEGFSLRENEVYDMANQGSFSIGEIKNITIKGNNATIKNLTVKGDGLYLFSSVDSCTISNITFENLTFTNKNPKGLFGSVKSSTIAGSEINGIKVTYAGEIASDGFSGIASSLENGSKILNCSATFTANGNSAGIVDRLISGEVKGCTVNATINGGEYAAGLVKMNNGTVSDCTVENFAVANVKNSVAGLVEVNNANANVSNNSINNLSVNVTESTADNAKIAGLIVTNHGGATNNKVAGEGIKFSNVTNITNLQVAGIVVYNDGTIDDAYNTMAQVGNYNIGETSTIAGKNIEVAGIVVENAVNENASNSRISKVVSTSNLAGNTVAGVAVRTSGASIIDQVLIGFNGNAAARNTIEGDKFVVGVVYEMRNTSSITNIQTHSSLIGKTSASDPTKAETGTISSLVALIFPNGTKIENAMIDNAASGFGTLYKETWTDYEDSHKDEDLPTASFNLLSVPGTSGTFRSVVINTAHITADGLIVKQSYFKWTMFGNDYDKQDDDKEHSNFFNYGNDDTFNSSLPTQSVMTADGTNAKIDGENDWVRGWRTPDYKHDWTFDSNVWNTVNGTTLSFLNGGYTAA